jgi:tRNA (guanine37-N1)-methyltransferase
MVIQAEPIFKALQAVGADGARFFGKKIKPHVIYLSPQGKVLTQKRAQGLSEKSWLVFLCGHYEGIDERIMGWIDEEISIGDYVLTGGEIPAMVLADTVLRLVPGVVKDPGSLAEESFQEGRLDFPHYTRPAVWRKQKVPSTLLSGDHAAIRNWREKQALQATRIKRPDLLKVRRKP